MRQLCLSGLSGLRGRQHEDEHSHTSWGKCAEESGRGDGRHLSRKLKGKVLNSCVTPAYIYGLETMAMTDKTTRETAFVILRE